MRQSTALKSILLGGTLAVGLALSPFAIQPVFADAHGGNEEASQGQGPHGGNGQGGPGGDQGQMGQAQGGRSLDDIFHDVAGVPGEDTGRPDSAGPDDSPGGAPDSAGSKRGDDFGDLWVILRDDNGIPELTEEGWVQPLDAEGNLIPLDEEGHPIDESLTIEVDMGRLNVGRAPSSVLSNRADEVVTLLNNADAITTDAAGRLVITVDGEDFTIDSPLENLALYVALMTDGTIPGVSDLPGDDFDFMTDGVYTTADLEGAIAFLAAATDKTGSFTADEIAYIDAFLGINTTTEGDVTYSVVEYSEFTYDRSDTYSTTEVTVLVEQSDGSWEPETVNVYDAVFGGTDYEGTGTIDVYTQAADDARAVVNFIHEYAVPAPETN
jgi:hypothetical protein